MTDSEIRALIELAHEALSGLDERMKVDAYYGGNVRPHVVRAIAALKDGALTQLLAERAVPPREPTPEMCRVACDMALRTHNVEMWLDEARDYWIAMYDVAAPAAAEPRDADCESCGGSGEAVVYHCGGPYGDREVIKCRDCNGIGLADSTLAEQQYASFTAAETLAGREATREANAGVECAHGDNAAMPRMASFPPNETLRQQIANDPDDEPSAGDYECTR